MSNQESKKIDEQLSPEVSQTTLNTKLEELKALERRLFAWDGELWWKSSDTLIDKKFSAEYNGLLDLGKKIEIISSMLDYFSNWNVLYELFSSQKKQEANNDFTKTILSNCEKEISKLTLANPWAKDAIIYFVSDKFAELNELVKYFKKEKILNEDILNNSYSEFQEKLFLIEWYISDIKKCSEIKDKDAFLKYYLKNWFWNEWSKWLFYKLNELFQIKFIKEWFSDDETASNYSETFWYWSLVLFMKSDVNLLKKLDDLLLNNKEAEIISLIEWNFSPIEVQQIFWNKKISDIYLKAKRKEVWLTIQYWKGKLSDELILESWKIKDSKVRTKILLDLADLVKNFTTEKLSNFLNENGLLKNILSQNISENDKIIVLWLVEKFIAENITANCTNDEKYNELNNAIFQKSNDFYKLKSKIIDEKALTFLARLSPNDRMSLERDFLLDPSSKERYVLWVHNSIGQAIRELDKIPKQNIQENAQKSLKKFDLWEKYTIDDKWKIVTKEYQQKINEAIAKWETPPKMNEKTNIEKIGFNWSIEFWIGGEIIYTSSLWYKFDCENNFTWFEKAINISERFDYLHKIWIWYFWKDFRSMIDCIEKALPKQALWINISEGRWDFLGNFELDSLLQIFKNVWIISIDQNTDYFMPDIMSETDMNKRLVDLWKEWMNFYNNGVFNRDLFIKLLQTKNEV